MQYPGKKMHASCSNPMGGNPEGSERKTLPSQAGKPKKWRMMENMARRQHKTMSAVQMPMQQNYGGMAQQIPTQQFDGMAQQQQFNDSGSQQ